MARPHTNAAGEMRCLCATVRRASRLLTRRYEEALRPAGLNPSQFELLMTLRHAAPIDQRGLAELMETDQTTLSRNLRVLERERWVKAGPDERDGRRRLFGVTPLGLAVLVEAQRCWRHVHGEMERLLGEPMLALWPALDRILAAASEKS